MASPPFQLEDQTDADFFDKLVDDEFRVSESNPSFVDGVDSDEVKAFSNLNIVEVGNISEDSGGEGGFAPEEEKHSTDVIVPSSDAPEKDILVSEESISLVSSNSVVLDNRVEFSDGATGVDVSSESSTSKSSGSKSTSIKEVQWSSFYADSAQNGGNGFGSYSDFFREEGDPFANVVDSNLKVDSNQDEQAYVASIEQIPVDQNLDNSQYWENLYPGWRYDPNTGEWHQVEDHNAAANAPQVTSGGDLVSGQTTEVSYLQQAAQSVVGTVAEGCTTGNVSTWNQASQESTEYPSHMVFDPQYPGWYYDTIAQEWCALESYTPAVQSTSTAHDQKIQDRNDSNTGFFPITEENNIYGDGSQRLGGQNQGGGGDWAGSGSNNVQQNLNMWQLQTAAKTDSLAGFTENRQSENLYGSRDLINNFPDQQMGFKSMGTSSLYEQTSHNYGGNDIGTGFQSFVPANNFSPQISLPKVEQSQSMPFSHDYYGSQKSTNYSHQPFQTGTQLSFNLNEGRSSAGRPPHALVTFGFGGKLVVMKDNSSFVTKSAYGSQDSVGGSISVLDLMDVVIDKNSPIVGVGVSDYFRTLCQQSFPGPLVGGSVGSKELNKWIDERITNCESPNMDYRKGTLLRLLLSLLKIACQHYGKLRSPFGTDPSLKESDRPESAVAKLFGSAKRNGVQPSGYGALIHCLQNVPSEGQLLATAAEVQNLLVSGRTKEALQYAQEGQLWGPALILAAQLGDQYYVDTVKQMAHRQLVAGSPLRTLCLLIAGQPADVFSADSTTSSALPGAVNMSQPYPQILGDIGPNGMLDDWEENLAIITSNRTKGDELVILHLGDCLWKERGEITAAHICYLVAEANFESFSDGARLCLIGADHWKFPRTYASPEAIQRTELYEYSMVLGNSQSILLPFQPYKLIYAHMLAEVGKVSDSLKYCQAVLKSLKTGRAPEVDVWKQLVLSLEERIRTNQQGGFSTNLAAGKLVGKLLPFIDRSIHRMMGPLPPPAPSVQTNEHDSHVGPRVANSQSTMAVSSLMPSASMEPISEWMGESSRMSVPNRSISEPDFGRSPRQGQVDQSKGASSDKQGKSSVSGGPSRFGRFGSQILQKTMGWVSRSPSERQAKLGEKNKFYYDENLKRWVEEGAEPPAEQTALPPPPPTAAFQNGMSGYNTKTTFQSESSPSNGGPEIKSPTPLERTPGIPPIPPSSNQFSARGRMGVRSRYVDTFNKGSGTPTNLFQSPSLPSAKTVGGANAKFFIPTPATSGEQTVDTAVESMQEAALASTNEDRSTSMSMDSFSSPLAPSSTSSMQRFPSMNSITPTGNKGMGMQGNSNGSLSSHSRRTASWSGSINDAFNPPKINEVKPLGEALGMPPSSFMPSDSSSMRLPMNGSGSFGDDLHEVEL